MIKPLPDGRFKVVVRCADHVTRWRVIRYEGTAQFYEAIFLAGWYDQPMKAPRRKTKTNT